MRVNARTRALALWKIIGNVINIHSSPSFNRVMRSDSLEHPRFTLIALISPGKFRAGADFTMMLDPGVHAACVLIVPDNCRQFSPPYENSTTTDCSLPASSITESRRKRRALIVDDVLDVLDMLRALLIHAGFDVVTANSAPAAVNAAREDQFDVIISDIGMPGMNGYELARVLRALPGYEGVPMVAVTGYSSFGDRGKAMNAGFTAHMTKPIDPQSLLDLLESL